MARTVRHCSDCGEPCVGATGRCVRCATIARNKARDTKPELRFWSRVVKSEQCWLWTGSATKTGYGMICVGGKYRLTHRYSYELAHGPIPDGLFVCHTCDNRLCVNPAHLYLGTHKQNMEDRNRKERQAHGPACAPKNPATGKRNGKYTKPEATPRGDNHWSHKHPERYPRGTQHHAAKLTEAQVLEIRAITDLSCAKIAEQYGVKVDAIWRIRTRKTWTHLP